MNLKRLPTQDARTKEWGCRVCETDQHDTILRARIFTGSYVECTNYIRTHKPPRRREFAIIYNESGHMASFIT